MKNFIGTLAKIRNSPLTSKVVWVTVLLILAASMNYLIRLHSIWIDARSGSIDTEMSATMGQLGDFVGGLMNPVVGIISIGLLVVNLTLQQAQMKAQRVEVAAQHQALLQQRFEQTFFTWLNDYRSLVGGITSQREGKTGLQAVEAALHDATTARHTLAVHIGFRGDGFPSVSRDDVIAATSVWYQGTLGPARNEVETALRTLYTLIRWVKAQTEFTEEQRRTYVSIARARLSAQELEILFFNSFTPRGRPFTALINEYALLDNMPDDVDPLVQLLRNVADPFKPSAYDSNKAREVETLLTR